MAAKEKKTPENGPKKRPAPAKSRRWALLLLVSAWMFVLGVLVGRGTAPVHFDIEALQNELASLREAVLEKEKNRFPIPGEASENAGQLQFYENLKKAPPEKKPPAAVDSRPKAAPKPPPAPDDRTKRAETPAAKPKPETAPKLGAGAVSAAEKPFTIQVASLKEQKTANTMVDRLRANGYPAYRERADIEGKGTWHRVRIGSFSGPADAADTLAQLKSAKLKPMLIRK